MLHGDVLSLYGVGLPCKPQPWNLSMLCVFSHPLFHLTTIALDLETDLSSFCSTMHVILHRTAVKAGV